MINLARSLERRAHMQSELARSGLGLAAGFFEAVDGRGLPAAERAAGLSPAEQGCLLSHMAAWRRIASQDEPFALVLEDDCRLLPAFGPVLASPSLRPAGACIVLLGHHSARHPPARGAEVCVFGRWLAPGVRLARLAEFPMGAYAYLLTPAAAQRLLRHAQPPRMPADWVTGYAPSAGVEALAVSPPCVVPHGPVADASTIVEPAVGAPSPVSPAAPRYGWRRAGGLAWLWLRKLGVRPYGYSKAL